MYAVGGQLSAHISIDSKESQAIQRYIGHT